MFFVSYFPVHTFNMYLCSYLNKICFQFSCFVVCLAFECIVVCLLTKGVKREELVDFTKGHLCFSLEVR